MWLLCLIGAALFGQPIFPPTPTNINPTQPGASIYGKILADEGGNAHLIYRSGDGYIYAVYKPSGSAWSPPLRISTSIAGNALPSSAIDNSGNVVAIWPSNGNAPVTLYAARLPQGGSWSPPQAIGSLGTQLNSVQVVFDSEESAIAIWKNTQTNNATIQIARASPEGNWSAAQTISYANENNSVPFIATDKRGNALAVWATDTSIYSAYGDGTRWFSPSVIASTKEQFSLVAPSVAFDGNDNPIAIWLYQTYDTSYVAYIQAAFGSNWAPPQWGSVETATSFRYSGYSTPAISIAPQGTAYVTWQGLSKSQDQGAGVYLATRTAGAHGTWQETMTLSPGKTLFTGSDLAIDSSGNVIAAWAGFVSNGNSVIQTRYCPEGGSWLPIQSLTPDNTMTSMPCVSFDPAGNAYASFGPPNAYIQASIGANHSL